MANRNRSFGILVNQAAIELGDDMGELGPSWDPNQTGHNDLCRELGGHITERTPLRCLLTKNLENSDVCSHQNRFVISTNDVENMIFRCLTLEQRIDLCNNGKEIQVAGFDEQGRRQMLKLKKRMQSSHETGTYVIIGGWTRMVKANGWLEGEEITIWGFPLYGGPPRHDSNEISLVFTSQFIDV